MNRSLRRREQKIAGKPRASLLAAQAFTQAVRCQAAGALDEAHSAYRRVLALQPDHAEAHYGRGLAFHTQGRLEEAAEGYRRAVVCDPRHAGALGNLGVIFKQWGRLAEAETVCRESLAIDPSSTVVRGNLGAVLLDRGEIESAAETLRQVLAADPGHVNSLANLCAVLRMQGRLDEAVAIGRRAVAAQPRSLSAQFNLALVLADNGRLDESLAGFGRALALEPSMAEAHFALAQAYLRQGDFPRGWEEYEWRWRLKDHDWVRTLPGLREKPRWAGEDIADKTILIFAEQGLGDTIQFIRYLPRMVARAGQVVLWIQPALKALLRDVEGVTLIGMDEAHPNFDVHCPLLSLPGVLATSLESIPPVEPCISADADAVDRWRLRLGEHGLKIGIAWQGKPGVNVDQGRSIPLAAFAPLARVPGVRLISLQKNAGVEQLAALPDGMKVETLGEDFDSGGGAFLDAAAVMMNLDLVVTSDTAIAHLAGTLGVRPGWRCGAFRTGAGCSSGPIRPGTPRCDCSASASPTTGTTSSPKSLTPRRRWRAGAEGGGAPRPFKASKLRARPAASARQNGAPRRAVG